MTIRRIVGLGFAIALLAGGFWLWTPDRPRARLEAKYLDDPADYVDVAGLRLHLRDSGPKDAPALILLHGFGSGLHTWEPWARALRTDFRVIRFDLPGFGLTGADPSGDYTTARGVEVVAAAMDRLGVTRASVIGHSMGGKLAWNFAARHPGRVDTLVLIAPDGFASPGITYGKTPDVPIAAEIMRYVLPKALLRMSLAPAYGDPAALSDETVTRYHDLMLAPGVRDAIIAKMKQAVLEPPEPLLSRITAPTLLLWGEKDAMIPASHAQDYLRILPNARLVVLPGLGHVLFEEAPARALEPVRLFLTAPR